MLMLCKIKKDHLLMNLDYLGLLLRNNLKLHSQKLECLTEGVKIRLLQTTAEGCSDRKYEKIRLVFT